MRKFIVLGFYLFTQIAFACGQPANDKFEYRLFGHYSTDNGLVQNTITGIGLDNAGYLWFGTEMGIVRFDGRNLLSFQPEVNGALFKRTNGIFSMIQTAELISRNRFLDTPFSIVRIRDGHFVPARQFNGVLSKFSSIATEHKPVLPIPVLPSILSYYFRTTDFSGCSGYYLPDKSSLNSGPPDNKRSFYVDKSGSIEFASPLLTNEIQLAAAVFGQRLYILSGDSVRYWISGSYQGRATGSLPRLFASLSRAELHDMFFLQQDTSVLFFGGGNVYEVVQRNSGILDAKLIAARPAVTTTISNFYYDRNGGILILGTTTSGFFFYRRSNFRAVTADGPVINAAGPAQTNAPANNMFNAVEQFGPDEVVTTNGVFKRNGRSLMCDFFKDVHVINRTSNGMYIMDATDSGLKLASLMPGRKDCRAKLDWQISCNNGDTVSMCRFDKIVEFCIRGDSAILLRRYPKRWLRNISALFKLGPDSFAAASLDGFEIFNAGTNAPASRNELTGKEVRSLFHETNGDILIGTYGEGWYRYSAATRRLQRMPEDRLHRLATVHAFLPDTSGFLWLSTNNGLFRISRHELQMVKGYHDPLFYNYFSKEYGFLSNEFNGNCAPAGVRLSNGNMVFPSMEGLVWFQPDAVPVEELRGNIRIDKVIIDNVEKTDLAGLQLSPDFNNMIIHFSAPYFGNPYNQNFEYRILNGSAQWTPISVSEPIRINRLIHGNYRLQIRALARYGGGQYITASVPFVVAPFWYQTIWFWAGLVVLVAVIAWAIILRRTRQLQQQKASLEEQVMQRTDDLRISEERVRKNAAFRNQVTSLVLHDIRSPLYYLGKITGNIYHKSSGKIPEALHEELYTLHESVSEVSGYTQKLLTWLNAQEEGFSGRIMAIRVKDFLQQLCQPYLRLAAESGNDVIINCPEGLVWTTQPDLLNVVLRNILDNALKHTRDGVIELSASMDDAWAVIGVRDTGPGIPDEKIAGILSAGQDDQAELQAGLGYRIVKDLLLRLDGKLDIQSSVGAGTKVIIRLPIPATS